MRRRYSLTNKEKGKLKDPLVSNFLNDKNNHQIFSDFIESPNLETKNTLDAAFKSYYKRVKVISYIDKLIYFYSIDLDKRKNKHNAIYRLILDRSIGKDNSTTTMKDTLTTNEHSALYACIFPLVEILEDLQLYEAWNSLSDKQKKILTLKYQHNLKDIEIADILAESKQVISYNHNKAINILKKIYNKN